MAIEKLTEEQVGIMREACPTLHAISVGDIVNSLIDAVNKQEPCGYVIDSETLRKMNAMCVFDGIHLGDYLAMLIDVTKESAELVELTNRQKRALNTTCIAMRANLLGDKLHEIAQALKTE